jgi:hypothetical protein
MTPKVLLRVLLSRVFHPRPRRPALAGQRFARTSRARVQRSNSPQSAVSAADYEQRERRDARTAS